jgi:hypothetical protein
MIPPGDSPAGILAWLSNLALPSLSLALHWLSAGAAEQFENSQGKKKRGGRDIKKAQILQNANKSQRGGPVGTGFQNFLRATKSSGSIVLHPRLKVARLDAAVGHTVHSSTVDMPRFV